VFIRFYLCQSDLSVFCFDKTELFFLVLTHVNLISQLAIDAPGGFLFEWWSVFWDIFISRTNDKHSDVATSYIEVLIGYTATAHVDQLLLLVPAVACFAAAVAK
jgi:hypothetical protein